MEQRAPGTLRLWAEPFVNLRVPKIFNLRTDPYERADITSNTYYDWLMDHVFLLVPAQDYVGQFLATLQGIPAASEGGELQPRRGHGQAEATGTLIGVITGAAERHRSSAVGQAAPIEALP